MIISKTPFRISFFGGGTDYPDWYRKSGGAVISTTIDKYCYITCRYLPPFFEYKYRVRYYSREEALAIEDIKHPSVRECLLFHAIDKGVEIVHHADLPARSGLGSSSTFTVSLLHALSALKHVMPTKYELAINAIKIEQDKIGEHVGSQDQTAAAFGGLNKIEFGGCNEINVLPMILMPENEKIFQAHLLLFFTGFSRTASTLAETQIIKIPQNEKILLNMMAIVGEAESILMASKLDMNAFGKLMHEQWMMKKGIDTKISNNEINDIYDLGIAAGAIGGKLLGAGGGGFMLFIAEPSRHENIKIALKNLLHVPIRMDKNGSQIIYHSNDDDY